MAHTLVHAADQFLAWYETAMAWIAPAFVVMVVVLMIYMLLFGPRYSPKRA